MTRMSREFSLVLLGSGLLTAGYFVWPEQDYEKRVEEQARKRVGGNGNGSGRSGGMFVYVSHGGGSSVSGRSPAMASVPRSGFGTIGGRVGGGIGS